MDSDGDGALGPNQVFLMNMRSHERSDAAYRNKVWSIRNAGQDALNRERRALHSLPHAQGKWVPRNPDPQPALPTLFEQEQARAALATNVSRIAKAK